MKRLLLTVFLLSLLAVQTAGAGLPLHLQKKAELFGKVMSPADWVELRQLLRAETGREKVLPNGLDRLCDVYQKEMRNQGKAFHRFQIQKLEKTLWTYRIEAIYQDWSGSDWVNALRMTETFDTYGQSEFKIEAWNGTAWVGIFWSTTTYDPVQRKEVTITQTYDPSSSSWVNNYRDTWWYDASGNNTNYLSEAWDGSAWANDFQGTATYDGSGNRLTETYQMWNGSGWDNLERYLYTYDAHNNELTATYQYWNGSDWENEEYDVWAYDANNNVVQWTGQYWDGSAWVNEAREMYAYDIHGNKTYETWQEWDGSAWVNTTQILRTYDASGNMVKEQWQEWNGAGWDDINWYLCTYDAAGHLLTEVEQEWDGSAWVNVSQSLYSYDVSGLTTQVVDQEWDGSAWVNDSRVLFTWTFNTDVAEEGGGLLPQRFTLGNYPNPFNPETAIQFALPRESEVTVQVFDVRGSLVRTLTAGKRYGAGTHTVKWDGRDTEGMSVPSGVYLYRLESSEFTQTNRCVLMK